MRFLVPIPNLVYHITASFQNNNLEFHTDFRKKVIYGYENIVPIFYPKLHIRKILNEKDKIDETIRLIINFLKEDLYKNEC